jgi:hypothetical protein
MGRPTTILRPLQEHPLAVAVGLSAALAAAYLLWQPATTDLAAQIYRAELWEREGWVLWSPEWYGGFLVPGYSLIYPPLGAWVGPAAVGALSAVAAAALFGSLALRAFGQPAWIAVIWFGAASTAAIWSGRITFALGMAIGLAALWCVQRRRGVPAGALGALGAAASPVAGLFTALAAAAVLLADRFGGDAARSPLPAGAAWWAFGGTAAGVAAVAVAFPTEGYHPFTFSSFWPVPVAAAAVAAVAWRESPVLRWGALLYLVLALVAVGVETPLGGNAARLGATFAGPIAALLLWPQRALLLAIVALPLLWWQWTAPVSDVTGAEGDRSTEATYYMPLLHRLEHEPGGLKRVHVPPTQRRWEAAHLPPEVSLAGGWLRQLESGDFDFLEQDELDPDEYRAWLASRGVSYVAVNDAEPDRLAVTERRLLDSGVFEEEEIWSSGHWRLYRFDDPQQPRLAAEGELIDASPTGFSVRLGQQPVTTAFRYVPYFVVTEGSACVERVERDVGWDATRIVPLGDPPDPTVFASDRRPPPRRQTVRVKARLSLAGALGRDSTCP